MNFILWSNIYLVAFYGFYWFFLRKETFFQLNRGYLMGGMVLPFIIPLLDLKKYFISSESGLYYVVSSFEAHVNQVVHVSDVTGHAGLEYSVRFLLIYGYLIGCAVAFSCLIYRGWIMKKSLNSSKEGEAYSFFNRICVDPKIEGYAKVVEHEKVHAKEGHSIDVLLIELIKVLNWFNPIVYMLNYSIKLNHEYIADQISAVKEEDRIGYAELLLSQALCTPIYTLRNNFYTKSFIKNRITMLVKSKSKKVVLGRFLILIPVLVGIISFQTKVPDLSALETVNFEVHNLSTFIRGEYFKAVRVGGIQDASEFQVQEKSQLHAEGKIQTAVKSQAKKVSLTNVKNLESESSSSRPFLNESNTLSVDTGMVFESTEIQPQPPGGMHAFLRYIGNNYRYPASGEKAKVSGRVVVTFIVEKDGSLSDFKIVRDLGFGTGEEAVRVIKESKKWSPGIQNGKPVRVQYTLPIVLNLANK